MAIHRAIYGSLERFIGILVEHFAGAFPFWCAPVQAVVVPIADRHNEAAGELAGVLRSRGIRVEVDDSSNRMQNKIRVAQEQKVPYMLVLGDREIEARTAAAAPGQGRGAARAVGWEELATDSRRGRRTTTRLTQGETTHHAHQPGRQHAPTPAMARRAPLRSGWDSCIPAATLGQAADRFRRAPRRPGAAPSAPAAGPAAVGLGADQFACWQTTSRRHPVGDVAQDGARRAAAMRPASWPSTSRPRTSSPVDLA